MNRTWELVAAGLAIFLFSSCDKQQDSAPEGDPEIVILSPSANGTISGTVTVMVDGLDFSGGALDNIAYYVDDVAIYTDPNPSSSSPSSTWQWETPMVLDGPRELKVIGRDNDGRVTKDSISTNVHNADEASGAVRSDGSAVIESPSGARLTIPVGAVPRYEDDNIATVVFSIEVDEDTPVSAPPGTQIVSKVYRLGPGAFVFARPVLVTLPIFESANPTGFVVTLYRINPTTQVYENYGGSYDEIEKSVSGQTYELSSWFLAMNLSPGASSQDWGCIEVDNSSGSRLTLCVVEYELTYPQVDQPLIPETGLCTHWATSGEFDWLTAGHWWLPQGEYIFCVQTEASPGSGVFSRDAQTVTVSAPAFRIWGQQPVCEETIHGHVNPIEQESCTCIPEPSIPYGTGDVQVTLTWFNVQSIDMDLWVTDPDGERCYYANSTTASGGELDRDNLCGNYINGHPENIFWQTAPAGEYIVQVDWFSNCGHSLPSQPVNVRIINLGQVTNFDQTCPPDGTIEVCRFRVAPHGITIDPSHSDPIFHEPNPYSDVNNKRMMQ